MFMFFCSVLIINFGVRYGLWEPPSVFLVLSYPILDSVGFTSLDSAGIGIKWR